MSHSGGQGVSKRSPQTNGPASYAANSQHTLHTATFTALKKYLFGILFKCSRYLEQLCEETSPSEKYSGLVFRVDRQASSHVNRQRRRPSGLPTRNIHRSLTFQVSILGGDGMLSVTIDLLVRHLGSMTAMYETRSTSTLPTKGASLSLDRQTLHTATSTQSRTVIDPI